VAQVSVQGPALGLLECDSIAAGVVAGDAMVTNAPVRSITAGTVQPGHYLIMVDGDPQSVELAMQRGISVAGVRLIDSLYLALVDPRVPERLVSGASNEATDAVGVLETGSASSAIRAADAGCKGADVSILGLRVCDGLGGRGLVVFGGHQRDVEAALDLATSVAATSTDLVQSTVVPRIHPEMAATLTGDLRFGA